MDHNGIRDQNEIKPMRTAASELAEEPPDTRKTSSSQPKRLRQHVSHARTASPHPHARHARMNKIEINFLVYGRMAKPN